MGKSHIPRPRVRNGRRDCWRQVHAIALSLLSATPVSELTGPVGGADPGADDLVIQQLWRTASSSSSGGLPGRTGGLPLLNGTCARSPCRTATTPTR